MRWLALGLLAIGCGSQQIPNIELTAPARLCENPALRANDFCLPAERMEELLRNAAIDITYVGKAGHSTSRVRVLYLSFPEQQITIRAKWKPAARGGEAINNTPRRELAAYAVQKLFLDPQDYVVPPCVGRCISADFHRRRVRKDPSTFDGIDCVFGVLTYWVENLTDDDVLDKKRFERDPAYRRTVAHLNLLTYLIDHRDARRANFMISRDPERPRAMAVDNGLAFSGIRNPVAWFTPKKDWSRVIVPALPRAHIDRLRRLTRADLDRLSVVAQYTINGRQLDAVSPGAPFDQDRGVRRAAGVIQLGLTTGEIDALERRLNGLLERVDKGEVRLF